MADMFSLPLSETVEVESAASVSECIRAAIADNSAVYPIGGGTSLDFGLPPQVDGIGVSLAKMNRVVDFPARDMTITVEPGITMADLNAALAAEGQQLPVDVPDPRQATLGGVVATAFNGPRRFGMGTIRDYVIGVSAVDGRGVEFKGGGRVVKNVAGYDFCKLLTGSLGTLAVMTQVTLKVRPLTEANAVVSVALDQWEAAEQALARLVDSATTPVAIETYNAAAANVWGTATGEVGAVSVLFEGTSVEVDWQAGQLADEWRQASLAAQRDPSDAVSQRNRWAQFPADREAPLVLKASVRPSGVVGFLETAMQVDPHARILSHAGSGIVYVKFSEFPTDGLAQTLVGVLQPAAAAAGGALIVLSNPSGAETTRRGVWGDVGAPYGLMTDVKRQFDPHNVLNPGRFVYNDYPAQA